MGLRRRWVGCQRYLAEWRGYSPLLSSGFRILCLLVGALILKRPPWNAAACVAMKEIHPALICARIPAHAVCPEFAVDRRHVRASQ
jgi:hypothetical protein